MMTDEKRMVTLGGLPQKIHIARGIKALVGVAFVANLDREMFTCIPAICDLIDETVRIVKKV